MFKKDDIKDILRSILRPPYYFIKDLSPYAGRLMSRNAALKNKYSGQKGFLLMSGESLNCIDILKLRGEYIAGYGFLFLHKTIIDLPLNFILAAEPGPAMDKVNADGSWNWPEKFITTNGKNRGYIFLKNIKEHFIDKGVITFLDANKISYYKKIKLVNFNEPNVFYIKSNPYLFTSKNPKLDLTKRFTGGDGGIFFILLIMIYMGFKEIYLAGAGYTYEPTYDLHFYDNFVFPKSIGGEKAEIEVRGAIDARNTQSGSALEYYGLFEKDNFYRGVCVQRGNHDSYKEHHRIFNNYARLQGVKIYNITPSGFESPIYEKITWQEVEGEILPSKVKR